MIRLGMGLRRTTPLLGATRARAFAVPSLGTTAEVYGECA